MVSISERLLLCRHHMPISQLISNTVKHSQFRAKMLQQKDLFRPQNKQLKTRNTKSRDKRRIANAQQVELGRGGHRQKRWPLSPEADLSWVNMTSITSKSRVIPNQFTKSQTMASSVNATYKIRHEVWTWDSKHKQETGRLSEGCRARPSLLQTRPPLPSHCDGQSKTSHTFKTSDTNSP